MQKYVFHQKSKLEKISISLLAESLPDLKNSGKSKVATITKWFIDRIENDKNIRSGMLLPSKPDMAYLLGVSIGTVQNAIKFIEDLGYVEAKQCVGTVIKNRNDKFSTLRKQTSKREIVINRVKQYILDEKLIVGSFLPSPMDMSSIINYTANITRLAYENMCISGILEHRFKTSEKSGWIVKSTDFTVENLEQENLVKKIENELRAYISNNLQIGQRIPAHSNLIRMFSVSIKTVHDAIESLIKEGILMPRRGQYGTVVLRMPEAEKSSGKKEDLIFAPAVEAAFYYYEKTESNIKKMISKSYKVGDKLPSVDILSQEFNVSPNTVRKAIVNLVKDGYLASSRGRYGGTFVLDIPDEQTFKWLSVNPKYAEVYSN